MSTEPSCFLWTGWVTSSYVITDETTKKLVLDKIVSGMAGPCMLVLSSYDRSKDPRPSRMA